MERYRVMTVGDYHSGKTCLGIAFGSNVFPVEYIPTVCDQVNVNISVNGKLCDVAAFEDSSHGEDYDRLRPLSYPGTDVFIALFAVDSRESFNNIKKRWIPEVQHYLPHAPFIIVANKTDLRVSGNCETISYDEGRRMAEKLGTGYFEVCCKELRGVEECYRRAVELAMVNTKAAQKMRRKMGLPITLVPPLIPSPAPEPAVKATTSAYADDWLLMLPDPKFHDVRFIAEGGKCFFANKMILCSASAFFTKVFLTTSSDPKMTNNFDRNDLNSGRVQGVSRVDDSQEGKETTLELSADIEAKTFTKLLEFTYTGRLSENLKDDDLSELKREAIIFDLPELVTRCDRVFSNQDSTKTPIAVNSSNDWKKRTMGKLFKQDTFYDIIFKVKDTAKIPAHKLVVYARSRVLAALIDSASVEGGSQMEIQISDASVENFTLLLEYLYTDHVQLDNSSDVIGCLTLAHQHGAHRLVSLCELQLKREVEGMLEKLEKGKQLNAVELLQRFQACKATQMVDWCFHYISHNYTKFSGKDDFLLLDEKDRNFIKQHRWPPHNYVDEFEEFERIASATPSPKKHRCVIG